ncbi:MAG: hypothetical protein M1592_00615 [Candidatus Thermoplasmatota archaeon]|nr:hypothetical protein [Candidatus Thermoplasmatota archaeon]
MEFHENPLKRLGVYFIEPFMIFLQALQIIYRVRIRYGFSVIMIFKGPILREMIPDKSCRSESFSMSTL